MILSTPESAPVGIVLASGRAQDDSNQKDQNLMRIHSYMSLAALVVALCLPWPAQAQSEGRRSGGNDVLQGLRNATRNSPLFWDVQTVIDEYVRVMAGHYDLSDTQLEYTRQLMNTRVKQFLKDYEKDVRILMGEYQEYRMRG